MHCMHMHMHMQSTIHLEHMERLKLCTPGRVLEQHHKVLHKCAVCTCKSPPTLNTWKASNCILLDWSLSSIMSIMRCCTSLTKRTITFTLLRSKSSSPNNCFGGQAHTKKTRSASLHVCVSIQMNGAYHSSIHSRGMQHTNKV